MKRRLHLRAISIGPIALDPVQSHHARDVLRIQTGTLVEVFDSAGASGQGEVVVVGPSGVTVRVDSIDVPDASKAFEWTIASAVPKGERADWMIEKLSELGTAAFVPLMTARSVVHPEGTAKRDRWVRIATEAAKQSRRSGVMRVELLTPVEILLGQGQPTWYLSPELTAMPVQDALAALDLQKPLLALIGPEGGWTPEEITRFDAAGAMGVRLTDTILRIETAAITTAALLATMKAR